MKKCSICNGRKKVVGLGCIKATCDHCGGKGYEPIIVQELPPIPLPIPNKPQPTEEPKEPIPEFQGEPTDIPPQILTPKRKRGRPPKIKTEVLEKE